MSEVTRQVDQVEAPEDPARSGMVATSHPVAAQIGAKVLEAGGNAVDAAIAVSFALGVVEPMSTGVGGDAMAIVFDPARPTEDRIWGYLGAGRSSHRAESGGSDVPQTGAMTVTVPGAVEAFARISGRFGTQPFSDLVAPAAKVAREGFEVTPVVARLWAEAAPKLRAIDPAHPWLAGGQAPAAGERFVAKELADTLGAIGADPLGELSRGGLSGRLADYLGGFSGATVDRKDLAEHQGEWVKPLSTEYRGHPVLELPPSTQGLAVLVALALLDDWPLADLPPEEVTHVAIECLKLAFADVRSHVSDPRAMRVEPEALLAEDRIEALRDRVGARATDGGEVSSAFGTSSLASPGTAGDTAYVAVVDGDGMACSLIHSVYESFGSGLVVPGTQMTLHNRGALFAKDPSHPNAFGPKKRPLHTILPALVLRAANPWLVLGCVGGFQQPQGQVQLLLRIIDESLSLEEAVVAPRFRWLGGDRIALERGFPAGDADRLETRGHRVERDVEAIFGGAQVVEVEANLRRGASDPRKDGVAQSVTLPPRDG